MTIPLIDLGEDCFYDPLNCKEPYNCTTWYDSEYGYSNTCEDCQEEDDFQCPVYSTSDFPTSDSIAKTSSDGASPDRHRLHASYTGGREPLFHVSIPSQCSLVEWRKRNVTMHASPELHIPDI